MPVMLQPLTENEVRQRANEVMRFADEQRFVRDCIRRARTLHGAGRATLRTYDALHELAAQFGGPLEQQVLDLATLILETAPGVGDAFQNRADRRASVAHCGAMR